jgi:hypothetical protein
MIYFMAKTISPSNYCPYINCVCRLVPSYDDIHSRTENEGL